MEGSWNGFEGSSKGLVSILLDIGEKERKKQALCLEPFIIYIASVSQKNVEPSKSLMTLQFSIKSTLIYSAWCSPLSPSPLSYGSFIHKTIFATGWQCLPRPSETGIFNLVYLSLRRLVQTFEFDQSQTCVFHSIHNIYHAVRIKIVWRIYSYRNHFNHQLSLDEILPPSSQDCLD